jgi:hypothetical protein
MNTLLILIAIIAIFLYYQRNKIIYPSNLPEMHQYIRLWIYPFFQFLICAFFLWASYIAIEAFSYKSPVMDQLIKDNLGVFSSIASDMFNNYRAEKFAPLIEQANEIHKYAIYLFYGSIASFIFHVYVLKNKILSKDFVHSFSIAFSIIILVLTYHYYYNSALFGSALVSTETLGLFGGSKEDAADSALESVGYLGTVLFFLHYYKKKLLLQYYYEPDEEVSTNDDYLNEKDKSEGQSDDVKS